MQENEVKFGEKMRNSENDGFSVEYSEATVRDFDMNPCACESPGLGLSDAQGFASMRCTPSPLVTIYGNYFPVR